LIKKSWNIDSCSHRPTGWMLWSTGIDPYTLITWSSRMYLEPNLLTSELTHSLCSSQSNWHPLLAAPPLSLSDSLSLSLYSILARFPTHGWLGSARYGVSARRGWDLHLHYINRVSPLPASRCVQHVTGLSWVGDVERFVYYCTVRWWFVVIIRYARITPKHWIQVYNILYYAMVGYTYHPRYLCTCKSDSCFHQCTRLATAH